MAPKGEPPRQLLLPHLCLPSWWLDRNFPVSQSKRTVCYTYL